MSVSGTELWQAISIMGKGMSGIFIIIGILMISVMVLNRFTIMKNRKGVD